MANAKLSDSRTFRRLAETAEVRGDPVPEAEILEFLAEEGEHIGVVVRVEEGVGSAIEREETGRAWVVWLLHLKGDDGRFMVVMVSSHAEILGLQEAEVTGETADMAVEFARECHPEFRFSIQPRAQGLRLVSVVAGQPGLCVRCRTNEPAVTDGNLLLAPEGPVCAGCLNLVEQLKWTEAALAILRKAGAEPEQIAEVEQQVASLRAQMGSGLDATG